MVVSPPPFLVFIHDPPTIVWSLSLLLFRSSLFFCMQKSQRFIIFSFCLLAVACRNVTSCENSSHFIYPHSLHTLCNLIRRQQQKRWSFLIELLNWSLLRFELQAVKVSLCVFFDELVHNYLFNINLDLIYTTNALLPVVTSIFIQVYFFNQDTIHHKLKLMMMMSLSRFLLMFSSFSALKNYLYFVLFVIHDFFAF